jgi:hypothetical protein
MSLPDSPGAWVLIVYSAGAFLTLCWLFWHARGDLLDPARRRYMRDVGRVLGIIAAAGVFWWLVWLIVAVERLSDGPGGGGPA